MKRKGASMPPGTPKNGDFHIVMNNNSIIMHNCTRNNQNKSIHHQINHYRRYFNYFTTINLNKNVLFFMLYFLLLFFISMPLHVQCDEISSGNNGEFVSGYSADIFTTTEFDYATRGEKKFGDYCKSTSECGFAGSVCDAKQRTCQCVPELPVTNQIDKCGKRASINESCFFNEQCEEITHRSECRDGKCLCFLDLVAVMNKHGILVCENYAAHGVKKFGDRCNSTSECGFSGSVCDAKQRTCQCVPELPASNQLDKCGKKASINESCYFNEQCEEVIHRTQCREGKCLCFLDLVPVMNKQGILVCETARPEEPKNVQYVDPAMIGILVVMALMFIIICVVLRLFSRARWRENRTIFNTPNPRLMNVSLLRDNKLLHGHERRGSKMSVRGPSRQPSMSSLRPHSPNPSLGKRGSRRGSRGSSNASATSVRSNRSLNGNYQNGGQTEASKPINVHESVTVEITEPKA